MDWYCMENGCTLACIVIVLSNRKSIWK